LIDSLMFNEHVTNVYVQLRNDNGSKNIFMTMSVVVFTLSSIKLIEYKNTNTIKHKYKLHIPKEATRYK